MMMLAMKQVTQAATKHIRRPMRVDGTPAVAELTKAPSVMRDEINCCLSVVMFHPVIVLVVWYPKIYKKHQYGILLGTRGMYLQEALHGLQSSNHTKIKPILKRAQDYHSAREKEARVVSPRVSIVVRHGVVGAK